MGTNYYLRKINSSEQDIHIVKKSMGWKPLFHGYPHRGMFENDEVPNVEISSIDDLRDEYRTGKYIIVSEYGDEIDWGTFEAKVIGWSGGGNSRPLSHLSMADKDRIVQPDKEGYEFAYFEFF